MASDTEKDVKRLEKELSRLVSSDPQYVESLCERLGDVVQSVAFAVVEIEQSISRIDGIRHELQTQIKKTSS